MEMIRLGGYEDTHGRYSPDGKLMAFSSVRRSKYEATLLDLQSGLVQPLVYLSQLDTGEVEFTDDGSAVLITSWDGYHPHVGKVRLSDHKFSVISDGNPSLWPAAR